MNTNTNHILRRSCERILMKRVSGEWEKKQEVETLSMPHAKYI